MNFFTSMFSGKGPISTTRVISFMTGVSILGVYIAQNVVNMHKCGGYADLPTNSLYALLIVMGAKVTQSIFGEKTPQVPPTPTATTTSAPAAPVTPAPTVTTTVPPKPPVVGD